MVKNLIRKVWKNKGNNQKLITIPKDSPIEEGDYVKIISIEKEVQKDGREYD